MEMCGAFAQSGNPIDDTLALILAGGAGKRLGALTASRAKPALHFGGKFRSIDFPLSNCLHSGIRRVAVLTQYQAHSLNQHLRSSWQFLHPQLGEFIESWPPRQGPAGHWYRGTADAVRQNLDLIRQLAPRRVMILCGDHVYKMNYNDLLATHIATGAAVTVGAVETGLEEAGAFGVLDVGDDARIVGFDEKPARPSPIPGKADRALVSMGIYLFETDALLACLDDSADPTQQSHDFGHDILPRLIQTSRVVAHRFVDGAGRPGYWRDIGTIDALWDANMSILNGNSRLLLHDAKWPIWTHEPQYPPALFCSGADGTQGQVTNSLVSNGCIVAGASVRHSVLSYDVRVGEQSVVGHSVLWPHVRIGRQCRIQRAIVEEGCEIPDRMCIGVDPVADASHFEHSAAGVVLVTAESLARAVSTLPRPQPIKATHVIRRARGLPATILPGTDADAQRPGEAR